MKDLNGELHELASIVFADRANDNTGLTKLKMPKEVNEYIEKIDNPAKERRQ